ncbi:hypothetical protein XENOCAPTIV_024685 [Xenoophorus captivus]|uniref:Uncharacterized protein n=1 Tax=Xenoophorus captivus TaxID=1517983 RepID=A0ABV0R3Z4_9TELE
MESHEGAAAAARDCVLDFSRLSLNTFNADNISGDRKSDTRQLFLNYNRLSSLPSSVSLFYNLEILDISNNGLTDLCEGITRLTKLKTLLAKNNRLDEFSLPKEFGSLQLEVLNFSGNRFEEIPLQCTKLMRLQSLSIGGNRLKNCIGVTGFSQLPIWVYSHQPFALLADPQCFQGKIFSAELSVWQILKTNRNFSSFFCSNILNRTDSCSLICRVMCFGTRQKLHSLRSLSLHNNLLTYLPREILSLVHLEELSLRGNPLVVRFVKEMIYDPPSLLELAGRTIKSRNIPYCPYDMPYNLVRYLDLASKCPNPKCAGMTSEIVFIFNIL